MTTKNHQGLFYPGSPAAKVMDLMMAPVGWALWAYLIANGDIESTTFIVAFLGGLGIYKCPFEIAAMLPKMSAGLMIFVGAFVVPVTLMLLMGDSLPEDSDAFLVIGGILMAYGLHTRMEKANAESR